MPIGGKKGRGAKAAAAAAARSALKNLGSDKGAPGLIPRSTPPRSATALAYQSPSKLAQIAAPVTTPASAANTQAGITPALSSMPMEEIQPVAATNLPPAAALPSQPAKVMSWVRSGQCNFYKDSEKVIMLEKLRNYVGSITETKPIHQADKLS